MVLCILSFQAYALNHDFDYPSDYAIAAHRMVDAMDDFAAPFTRRDRAYKHAPRWGIHLPNSTASEIPLQQQNYWMRPVDPYAWTEPHKQVQDDFPSHQWLPKPPHGVAALEQYLTILDGSWQGVGQDVLIIRGDRFRLYMNANQFRDGYISVKGNQLTMIVPNEKTQRTFEFAEFNGFLALKTEQGQVLRYKLISKH